VLKPHRLTVVALILALAIMTIGSRHIEVVADEPPDAGGLPPEVRETELAELELFLDQLALAQEYHQAAARPFVQIYTVVEGDTIWDIARRFGLDIDTLRWSNPELIRNPDYLRPGQKLVILPVRGAYHMVQAGDTLASLARLYGVSEDDIAHYPLNHLQPPYLLVPGQKLIIPYGTRRLALPHPDPAPGYRFAWPIVGRVTQGYSEKHRAVDIGAPYGSPVYAAAAGRVSHAGWAQTGYGFTVIIDHDDGWQTLYSHMKGQWVRPGDLVKRGQLIGEVGSTGNSSGAHVHFEIRHHGQRLNPQDYLPPEPQ